MTFRRSAAALAALATLAALCLGALAAPVGGRRDGAVQELTEPLVVRAVTDARGRTQLADASGARLLSSVRQSDAQKAVDNAKRELNSAADKTSKALGLHRNVIIGIAVAAAAALIFLIVCCCCCCCCK